MQVIPRSISLSASLVMLLFALTANPLFAEVSTDGLPNKLILLELLQKGSFDELHSRLSSYQREYEAGSRSDTAVKHAFHSFENSDPAVLVKLNEWVAKMPESYCAYLARGIHYAHLGWLSRGYWFAKETGEGRIENMQQHFDTASKDLMQALSFRPTLTVAYESLMSMSMALGKTDITAALFEKAKQVDPASSIVRRRYLFSLQPKWGGSIEAMQSFIDETQQFFSKNPERKVLSGYLAYTIGDMARRKDRQEAIRFYNLALDQGDHWWFFYERGRNYYKLKEYEKALQDFTRSLELLPQQATVLVWRGRTHYRQGRLREALRDFDLAIGLDALEPDALRGRGSIFYDQEKYDKASVDFENALKYGAHKSINWWKNGRLNLYKLKDYDKAAHYLKQATVLAPDDSDYWCDYSVALYYQKDCAIVPSLKTYLRLCADGGTCGAKRVTWARSSLEQLTNTGRCEE